MGAVFNGGSAQQDRDRVVGIRAFVNVKRNSIYMSAQLYDVLMAVRTAMTDYERSTDNVKFELPKHGLLQLHTNWEQLMILCSRGNYRSDEVVSQLLYLSVGCMKYITDIVEDVDRQKLESLAKGMGDGSQSDIERTCFDHPVRLAISGISISDPGEDDDI